MHHGTRAALHGLIALALGVGLVEPDHTLGRAGRLWPVLIAGACFVVAVLLGYVPLPSFVSALAAPGLLERFPGWMVHTASVDAEDTTDALTHVLLVWGAAVAVGVWGVAHWRRRAMEQALLVLGIALPIIALAHAFTNTTSLFGVVPTWVRAPYKFFAPFLSHAHAGSALLLAWPLVLYDTANRDLPLGSRVTYGAVAAFMAFAALIYGATGPLAVMGLMVVVLTFRQRWLPRVVLAAAAPFAILAVIGFDAWMDPGNTGNLHGRTGIWASTLNLTAHHWLLGAGGGTFADALSPYRTDLRFELWDHAHQDYLEWFSETGVVGVALALVAVGVMRPGRTRDPDRAWLISAGAAGVLIHALVDFPLRLPALAMSAAAMLAWRVVVHQERRDTSPWAIRAALIGVLVANLAGAAWQLRDRALEPASALLWSAKGGTTELAAATVRRLAPWRAELALYEARTLAVGSRRDQALSLVDDVVANHPSEPDALRSAARLYLALGEGERAVAAADRAVEEGRWDWRSHATRARVLAVVDRDLAAAAWHDAIEAGAPWSTFEEAWAVLPVGLYWVDAVQGAGNRQDAALGTFLLRKGDAEAAALAFEEATFDAPGVMHPQYVDALLKLDRLDQAEQTVALARSRYPEDPDWIAREAKLREKQLRWGDASALWMTLARRDPKAALRSVETAVQDGGPENGLRVLLRMQADGYRLDTNLLLRRAQLQARAGLQEECVRDLTSSGLLDRKDTRARAEKALWECRKKPTAP
ncbi:MAG: O-antigen ligase family protein [Alphaproteobacteria bacterium]|nr:O-antigen ligase family protein [Alphaproteobacteria bacterium]MCB9697335.1 O-antigen ligase family protein [Alphaproteobacteria bacterium]